MSWMSSFWKNRGSIFIIAFSRALLGAFLLFHHHEFFIVYLKNKNKLRVNICFWNWFWRANLFLLSSGWRAICASYELQDGGWEQELEVGVGSAGVAGSALEGWCHCQVISECAEDPFWSDELEWLEIPFANQKQLGARRELREAERPEGSHQRVHEQNKLLHQSWGACLHQHHVTDHGCLWHAHAYFRWQAV